MKRFTLGRAADSKAITTKNLSGQIMSPLLDYLLRYSLAVFNGLVGYCEWAEQSTKDERDLRWLILGPLGLFALAMLALPKWAALLLSAPLMIPIVFLGGLGLFAWVRR